MEKSAALPTPHDDKYNEYTEAENIKAKNRKESKTIDEKVAEIKAKHAPKESPSFNEQVASVKAKHAPKESPSFNEQVASVKAKHAAKAPTPFNQQVENVKAKYMGSVKKDECSSKKLVNEHKNLVDVLHSKDPKKLKEEEEKQNKELQEMKKANPKINLSAVQEKIRTAINQKKFSEADATKHIIDRDRGEVEAKKPKIKPLLQSERCDISSNGQWSLSKDNSVKPFGENIYNSTANIRRKIGRTGDVKPDVGVNNAVKAYTTSSSSMQSAHEDRQNKEQREKNKKTAISLKDMPEEKRQAILANTKPPGKKNEV